MAELKPRELTELYEAIIKPFGHPDPLGFMTRALILSGGDPDYIAVDGKRGFVPISPEQALEEIGTQEVQSLQSNVISALTMDRLYFNDYGSIDSMIIATHYGRGSVETPWNNEQKQLIEDVDDSREETQLIMYPPLATVNDVVKLLDQTKVDTRLTNDRVDFFKQLISGGN